MSEILPLVEKTSLEKIRENLIMIILNLKSQPELLREILIINEQEQGEVDTSTTPFEILSDLLEILLVKVSFCNTEKLFKIIAQIEKIESEKSLEK